MIGYVYSRIYMGWPYHEVGVKVFDTMREADDEVGRIQGKYLHKIGVGAWSECEVEHDILELFVKLKEESNYDDTTEDTPESRRKWHELRFRAVSEIYKTQKIENIVIYYGLKVINDRKSVDDPVEVGTFSYNINGPKCIPFEESTWGGRKGDWWEPDKEAMREHMDMIVSYLKKVDDERIIKASTILDDLREYK